MSIMNARNQLRENTTKFVTAAKDPVAYNLNGALWNMAGVLGEVDSKLDRVLRRLDEIEAQLRR